MAPNFHRILGLALPTNEPSTAKNFILSSLENFREVAPISTFLINFQSPWTLDEIKESVALIESYGFAVKWSFNKYKIEGKGMVPFNRIRDDACKLEDCIFYALIDDDFVFQGPSASLNKSAGQQYLDAIHYMTSHMSCGLVLMGGLKVPKYKIQPVPLDSVYITGKGFVMRALSIGGGRGRTLPPDSLDLVGCDEEKVSAGWRLFEGYYPAKLSHSRTLHYENHKKSKNDSSEGKVESGADTYSWNARWIVETNNSQYIRDHYNPKFRGLGYYNVLDSKNWNGIDVDDPEVVDLYTIDYRGVSTQELINYIESSWRYDV